MIYNLISKFILVFLVFGIDLSLNSNNCYINSITVDQNNKIVVGGFYNAADSSNFGSNVNFAIARYNADGTLDTTFNPIGGQPGIVTTAISVGTNQANNIDQSNSIINGIAIDSQNRIVAAGYLEQIESLITTTGSSTMNYFAVARYNEDGSLDTTFNPTGLISGVPGIALTNIASSDIATSLVLDANDNIIVAGYTYNTNNASTEVAIVKYLESGILDSTFNPTGLNSGQAGVVVTNVTANPNETFSGLLNIANSVTLDSQNRILIGGYSDINTEVEILVIRYNSDGSIDTTFNPMGLNSGFPGAVITTLSDDYSAYITGSAIKTETIDTVEKIIVVGTASIRDNNVDTNDVIVVRYNDDGTLDSTFNPGGTINPFTPGIVLTTIETTTGLNVSGFATDLVLDTSDSSNIKTVVSGYTLTTVSPLTALEVQSAIIETEAAAFLTLRYNQDGSLDSTFNAPTGYVITNIENGSNSSGFQSDARANSIVLDQDANIVIGGGALNDSFYNNFAIARYNTDGVLDTTNFNPAGAQPGVVITDINNGIVAQASIFQGSTVPEIPQLGRIDMTPDEIAQISSSFIGFRSPVILSPDPYALLETPEAVVEGTAHPKSIINIVVNDDMHTSVTTDYLGNWSVRLNNLSQNRNAIYAFSIDPISKLKFTSNILYLSSANQEQDIGRFELEIISPENNSTLFNNNILITGRGQPESSIAIFLDDRPLGTIEISDRGVWEYNLKDLSDGNHNFRVNDLLDDGISKNINFVLDASSAIAPEIIEPENNLHANQDSLIISGIARANSTLTLKINDKNIDNVIVNSRGKWHVKVSDFLPGVYKIQAIGKNKTNQTNIYSNIVNITISQEENKRNIDKKHIEVFLNGQHIQNIKSNQENINENSNSLSVNIPQDRIIKTKPESANELHFLSRGNEDQSYVIGRKTLDLK